MIEVINKTLVFKDEINYIKDSRIRENLEKMINLLPDYFFTIPASSTGKYHPEFASGEGGLVRHTKVALKIANELLNNDSIAPSFTKDESDLILFALLIHDGLKCGLEHERYVRFDHPILISNYLKEQSENLTLKKNEINLICSMLESHMGPWNTNNYSDVILPKPESRYQRFVHMCDYLASRKFINVLFDSNNNIIN